MATHREEVEALPECRNDHELGFVALACDTPLTHGLWFI